MPRIHKAFVTAIVILVTGVLALWQGSPIRADFVAVMIGFALASIVVLWVFPETSVRK
ncbi:MAG: hypothetical protein HY056_12350 [Proteobacteria bacterium]|nr:hypothetical protein [Pseudomonadota bacterium]